MKLFSALLLASISVYVQAAELSQFAAGKSQITFVSKQMGVSVDGRFGKFDAQFVFDPAKPESAKARVDVELSSVDAGSTDATSEVKGRDWLNVVAFPKASFVASGIKATSVGHYEARGALSIKGVSRETVVPFSIRNEGQGTWLEGGFVLPRMQFKIGEGTWGDTSTVADEIQVKFKLFLLPKK